MRLHVLGFPYTEMTDEWSACAFTQRTRDFASMMTQRGYEVFLYAGEKNQADVTEHVPLCTRAERDAWFPGHARENVFNDFSATQEPWPTFNARAVEAIKARSSQGDALCMSMGTSHRPVANALPALLPVETGIGYAGVWAPYRIFESVAWRHYLAAKEETDNLRWFDEVIPRGYFIDQFPLGAGGQDYLFMARLIARKGGQIASDLCQRINARLLVAGQGAVEIQDPAGMAPISLKARACSSNGGAPVASTIAPQERPSHCACPNPSYSLG